MTNENFKLNYNNNINAGNGLQLFFTFYTTCHIQVYKNSIVIYINIINIYIHFNYLMDIIKRQQQQKINQNNNK